MLWATPSTYPTLGMLIQITELPVLTPITYEFFELKQKIGEKSCFSHLCN